MSNSIISICNSALSKLGCERISSLTEDNKRARLCKEQYEKCRDFVLRSHPWNFATKRVALAPLASVPLFEYSKEFALPSDYLRALGIQDDKDYTIEDNKLLTNQTSVNLKYISKCEDVYKYDSSFVEALSMYIACELAYPMMQSNTLRSTMLQEYKRYMEAETRSFNGQEKNITEQVTGSEWEDSRFGVMR